MPTPEAPTPWTPEQIAAHDAANGAFRPEDATAWHASRATKTDRLRALKSKGVGKMTPQEKDETLSLLLERMNL